jgi:biopolymer transport protein ExbD
MSGSLESSDGKPNLTPMLDMVFQLVTFFMLVINFKSAAIDRNLHLPVVGSARVVESGGNDELLVLNIAEDGRLVIYGMAKDIDSYIAGEAAASKLAARRKNPNFDPETSDLQTRVVIRADRRTPFNLVYRVLAACQDQGFRQFALKAMNK